MEGPMNLAGGTFVSPGWSLAGHLTHIWLPPLPLLLENQPGASWCLLTIDKTCWSKERHVTPSALQELVQPRKSLILRQLEAF